MATEQVLENLYNWLIEHRDDTNTQIKLVWRSIAQTLVLLNCKHKDKVLEEARKKDCNIYEYDSNLEPKNSSNDKTNDLLRATRKTISRISQDSK